MVKNWEPGTQYNYGDVVFFEGYNYKIIQPHRSQDDWVPPVTPALWGKVPNEEYHESEPQHHGGGDGYAPSYQQPPQYVDQHINQQPPQPEKPVPCLIGNYQEHGQQNQGSYGNNKPDDDKKWYENDAVKYGGLAAGATAVAGGLYAAHKHHDSEKQEQQYPPSRPDEKQDDDKKWYESNAVKYGGLAAGATAVAGGLYAAHKHHESEKQEQQYPPSRPDEKQDDDKKWYENNAVKYGGLAVGATALAGGLYAAHKHHEAEKQEQQYQQTQVNRPDEEKWYEKDAVKYGGLAVGAAALAGGIYAAHKHHERKEQDD